MQDIRTSRPRRQWRCLPAWRQFENAHRREDDAKCSQNPVDAPINTIVVSSRHNPSHDAATDNKKHHRRALDAIKRLQSASTMCNTNSFKGTSTNGRLTRGYRNRATRLNQRISRLHPMGLCGRISADVAFGTSETCKDHLIALPVVASLGQHNDIREKHGMLSWRPSYFQGSPNIVCGLFDFYPRALQKQFRLK